MSNPGLKVCGVESGVGGDVSIVRSQSIRAVLEIGCGGMQKDRIRRDGVGGARCFDRSG